MSRGLIITKSNGNLGRTASNTDMVSAIVMNGLATDDLELDAIYELRSLDDAAALGLDADYDLVNEVLVFHHLERAFLRNPSIILHLMLVAQTVTLTEMVDKDNEYLAKVLREKNGTIVQWAVALNPVTSYEATLLTGLDADVVSAIPKAQELTAFEESKHRFSDGFIEGRSFNGTATNALDTRTLDSDGVTVVIVADTAISKAKEIYNGYAAVGDVLGLCSLAAVSQNIGELADEFNLTDANNDAFITAGLSSNKAMSEYSDADIETLHDKGHVFAESTPGKAGFWLNDSSTCTAITSDYAYKENNRTIKKAIKLARVALLPRLKRRIPVDATTGFIAKTEAKDIETALISAVTIMQSDGDVSGGIDAYVNPEQNVLADSKFECELTFVPVAIGRSITLKIGFKNPFK
ncbi:DUF2586 family protein [Polaribacter undariae]|uniref:DUF2586 family protein n=1 Tax=Polaribacter sejongensis TaxID=985043 RepID=A0AAJ1VIM4_9FLAO|nr:DUF2586 family protein [Polaribacter undariae]MDN3621344.1 DUF2586 family protein [Polaribacter undariae]UWD31886.1 DUF2586 family protein [Polaribacter undariae]